MAIQLRRLGEGDPLIYEVAADVVESNFEPAWPAGAATNPSDVDELTVLEFRADGFVNHLIF